MIMIDCRRNFYSAGVTVSGTTTDIKELRGDTTFHNGEESSVQAAHLFQNLMGYGYRLIFIFLDHSKQNLVPK